MNRRRSTRVQEVQIEKLISVMEKNKNLANGIQTKFYTKLDRDRDWNKLAELLNNHEKTKKSVDQWKKCWNDLKMSVRKKAASKNTEHDDINLFLSPLEKRLLKLGLQNPLNKKIFVNINDINGMDKDQELEISENENNCGESRNSYDFTVKTEAAKPNTSTAKVASTLPDIDLSILLHEAALSALPPVTVPSTSTVSSVSTVTTATTSSSTKTNVGKEPSGTQTVWLQINPENAYQTLPTFYALPTVSPLPTVTTSSTVTTTSAQPIMTAAPVSTATTLPTLRNLFDFSSKTTKSPPVPQPQQQSLQMNRENSYLERIASAAEARTVQMVKQTAILEEQKLIMQSVQEHLEVLVHYLKDNNSGQTNAQMQS